MAARHLLWDQPKQSEVEPGGDHVRRDAGRDVGRHVLRDDDDRVGTTCDGPRQPPPDLAGERGPASGADDAQQVAAPDGHDQRQTLRKPEQAVLAELSVDQVVVAACQAAPHAPPRQRVIPGLESARKVKHVDADACRPEELRLALDEVRGARLPAGRPLARDHQHTERRVHCRARCHRSRAAPNHSPTAGQGSWASQVSLRVPGG